MKCFDSSIIKATGASQQLKSLPIHLADDPEHWPRNYSHKQLQLLAMVVRHGRRGMWIGSTASVDFMMPTNMPFLYLQHAKVSKGHYKL